MRFGAPVEQAETVAAAVVEDDQPSGDRRDLAGSPPGR
jgi:hypothetical protein